jgi:hypothetical protein
MHSHGWDSKQSVIRHFTANKAKSINLFTFTARCSTHFQMSGLNQEPFIRNLLQKRAQKSKCMKLEQETCQNGGSVPIA